MPEMEIHLWTVVFILVFTEAHLHALEKNQYYEWELSPKVFNYTSVYQYVIFYVSSDFLFF